MKGVQTDMCTEYDWYNDYITVYKYMFQYEVYVHITMAS